MAEGIVQLPVYSLLEVDLYLFSGVRSKFFASCVKEKEGVH